MSEQTSGRAGDQPLTSVTTVADGVARISWGAHEPVDVVRREVASALLTHARVEALIDPDDQQGQRTASWSGMRREGVMRGVTVDGSAVDRVVYARVSSDLPLHEPEGFRAILNSFLPRKRAIGQMLIRTTPDDAGEDRVLMCQLTYKPDWDLPGGVVEVDESPRLGVTRELEEELGVTIEPGELLLTDWLPPWSGWEDALTLVFDGGVHDETLPETVVREDREIAAVAFKTLAEIRELATDFTARRVEAALARTHGRGSAFTESGRQV